MNGERHAPGCTYNTDEPCTCGLIARLIGVPLTPAQSDFAAQEIARLNRVLAEHLSDERLLSWVGTDDSRMVAVLREMYPEAADVPPVPTASPAVQWLERRPVCSLREAIRRATERAARHHPAPTQSTP